jgi:hypothetical protein
MRWQKLQQQKTTSQDDAIIAFIGTVRLMLLATGAIATNFIYNVSLYCSHHRSFTRDPFGHSTSEYKWNVGLLKLTVLSVNKATIYVLNKSINQLNSKCLIKQNPMIRILPNEHLRHKFFRDMYRLFIMLVGNNSNNRFRFGRSSFRLLTRVRCSGMVCIR